MKHTKKTKIINISFIIILSVLFFTTLIFYLKNNNVYSYNKIQEMDRFYSYDDLYYAKNIFNSNKDQLKEFTYSAVKHPLFLVYANTFTNVEETIFPNISFENHYTLIILFQMIVSIMGVVFLYLILTEIIKLKPLISMILAFIFMISNSIIISTVLIESFIYSSTLLILSYYFMSKQKYIINGILGVLIFGTTITNIIIWIIMTLFINGKKDKENVLKIFVFPVIALSIIIIIMLLFYNEYLITIINNFFPILFENVEKYTEKYTFIEGIKNAYYYLFISPFFYIDTVNMNQLKESIGFAISFIASANLYITIISSFVFVTISYYSFKYCLKYKDTHVLTNLLIIIYNIFLHYIVSFGLYEAFIYTPHYLFSIVLLMGLIYKHIKNKLYLICLYIIIIVTEILFNLNSIIDMIKLTKF